VNKVAKKAWAAGWNWEIKSVIWVMAKLKISTDEITTSRFGGG
jgi:hypothetical protein